MTSRLVKIGADCVLYRGDCVGDGCKSLVALLKKKWGPVQCITADPAYGEILKTHWEKKAQAAFEFYLELGMAASDILEDGASFLVWGGVGKPRVRPFFKAILELERPDLEYNLFGRHFITWGKRRAYGKKDDYLFTREELVWFVKGSLKPSIFNIPLLNVKRGYPGFNKKYPAKSEYKRRSSVWTDIGEYFRGKVHDAQKPQALYEVIYSTHSNKGGFVIDWCSGSGEAALAARKLGRKILLVENDRVAFDKMAKRLKAA